MLLPFGQAPTETVGQSSLYLGDCRSVLQGLQDNLVDSIVCDPPYELDFMGKSWDRTGIANSVNMWREALRVLKPGGYMLAFSHARTYHRMVCAIEDAGFEIRDQIMWIYGSGFPKSHNPEELEGFGSALKPAHEPICVARKAPVGSISDNWAAHGCGVFNIDACRVPTTESLSAGSGGLLSHQRDDKAYPNENGYQQNDKGRWPANIIHDGSDDVLDAFPLASGARARVTGNEPTANGFSGAVKYSGMLNRVPSQEPRKDSGSAARFFYSAKASKKDRDEGLEGDEKAIVTFQTKNGTSGEASSWSKERNTKYKNTHPTVKPTPLMRYLTRLVTPPGGLVLDHFMGSGSTGKASAIEGFKFIGIDMEQEYLDIAKARILHAYKSVEKPADKTGISL